MSSGCIRLVNDDIEDLYGRVQVGTKVVVLPGNAPPPSANAQPQQPYNPLAPPSAQARNVPPAQASVGPTDLTAPNQGGITSQPLPPPQGRVVR